MIIQFPKAKQPEFSDTARSIIELLGYPYKVFPQGTDRRQITTEYRSAAERGKTMGVMPILVRVDDTLEDCLMSNIDDGYSAAEVLEECGDAEMGKRFLDERLEDDRDELDGFFAGPGGKFSGQPDRITDFSSLYDFGTGDTAEMILFELPTEKPWEAAAYIPFGGWNECPEPADMVNVFRYWFEKFGAVPAVIGSDTLEMTVPAPAAESEARELAIEHFAFCPDRLFQSTETGSPAELAESLKVSTVWYFWWD